MKMITRLGLHSFGRFSLLGCRRSIGIRSICVVPDRGQSETLTPLREGSDSVAAAHPRPRWVMLNCYDYRKNSVADAKTVADAHDFIGRKLRVSFRLEQPPASSILYYDWGPVPVDEDDDDEDEEEEDDDVEKDDLHIIAAQGDSVLLEASYRRDELYMTAYDYFVYRASTGRPPSLSLLPGRVDHPIELTLRSRTTGLLHRSDNELLVAQIRVGHQNYCLKDTAELYMLRFGRSNDKWEIKWEVPIIFDDGSKADDLKKWVFPHSAVSVGNRFICWINYADSFLLYDDMTDATPKLRYVPLPIAPVPETTGYRSDDDELSPEDRRNMCGASAGAVRFVTVDPRCCCGSILHRRSPCSGSSFTFTVTSWTLTLSMDQPMTWVKEGVLDCEELWALPGYKGLPRVLPQNPVLSLDNPDIVCFRICEEDSEDRWMIKVDTRSKVLLSVVCTTDQWERSSHLPAQLMC